MTEPIDYDNLNMLKGVIGDDLKPILNTYLDLTPKLIEQIRQAIAQQDAADLKRHAHTLKGSSANLGAIAIPALSVQLEDMGRHNQLANADALFSQVEQAYAQLEQALQTYIAEF